MSKLGLEFSHKYIEDDPMLTIHITIIESNEFLTSINVHTTNVLFVHFKKYGVALTFHL